MSSDFTIKLNKGVLFTILIYVSLFLFCLYPYTDYDWGWHYRYGEYFVKNGHVMTQDIWSWTMPGYQWVNHEWLYDPLIYTLTNAFGFIGLSIIGAIVAVLSFHFSIRGIKTSYIEKALLAFLFAYLSEIVIFQGLRSQSISLLMLALCGYIIRLCFKRKIIPLIILPFLFLLWANLHGTFAFGILMVGLAVFQFFINSIKSKRSGVFIIDKYFLLFLVSFLISIGATFINPFGYKVYSEVWHHFQNPLLRLVVEWNPVPFWSITNLMLIMYGALVSYFFLKNSWGKRFYEINYYELIIFIFLLYLSFTARRYVAIFIVVTLPYLASFLAKFPVRFEKYKATTIFMIVAVIIALEIGIHNRIITKHLNSYGLYEYCQAGNNCSLGLVRYIKNNPPQGRGFNFYDWGGFLIGNGVPAKLFIDGRMHLWRNESGYEPMYDYMRIYYAGDTAKFKKYNFDWVAIPRNTGLAEEINKGTLGNYVKKYEDDTAVYYVKQKK